VLLSVHVGEGAEYNPQYKGVFFQLNFNKF